MGYTNEKHEYKTSLKAQKKLHYPFWIHNFQHFIPQNRQTVYKGFRFNSENAYLKNCCSHKMPTTFLKIKPFFMVTFANIIH